MSFDPMEIDPGIRDLVVQLRNVGFNTTDSGDGISKAVDGVLSGCSEAERNIHMVVAKGDLLSEADRLQALLPEAMVQATYDPKDGSRSYSKPAETNWTGSASIWTP